MLSYSGEWCLAEESPCVAIQLYNRRSGSAHKYPRKTRSRPNVYLHGLAWERSTHFKCNLTRQIHGRLPTALRLIAPGREAKAEEEAEKFFGAGQNSGVEEGCLCMQPFADNTWSVKGATARGPEGERER